MKLLELQRILGEQIEAMASGTGDPEQARSIASLAKQMINNADIVLRADKYMKNDGKRIDYLVGEINEETAHTILP